MKPDSVEIVHFKDGENAGKYERKFSVKVCTILYIKSNVSANKTIFPATLNAKAIYSMDEKYFDFEVHTYRLTTVTETGRTSHTKLLKYLVVRLG